VPPNVPTPEKTAKDSKRQQKTEKDSKRQQKTAIDFTLN